jgi:four helix bundle protein
MAQSFRDLKVWKKAIELTVSIYGFTVEFPKEETYGLTAQMRRASVSVASNIAEGSARGTKRDFRQFVKLARGSNCELQTQLVIARQLGFGNGAKCDKLEALSEEIGRMLSALGRYLTDEIRRGLLKSGARQLRTEN